MAVWIYLYNYISNLLTFVCEGILLFEHVRLFHILLYIEKSLNAFLGFKEFFLEQQFTSIQQSTCVS